MDLYEDVIRPSYQREVRFHLKMNYQTHLQIFIVSLDYKDV